MNPGEINQFEFDLVLQCILQRYGHDFRGYSRAHIERRIGHFAKKKSFARVSDLVPALLWDVELAAELVLEFSIAVTRLFRDPVTLKQIREQVLPVLKTYPFIKIWHPGCATGEEVYSIAVMLAEEGLLERALIYGTDFNREALRQARTGVFKVAKPRTVVERHHQSGARRSFTDYVHARYGYLAFSQKLKEYIVFADHNLVTDGAFGEMHLIVCQNVLIYFDRSLKERALGLFCESLVRDGFLCLGRRDALADDLLTGQFVPVSTEANIFRKRKKENARTIDCEARTIT